MGDFPVNNTGTREGPRALLGKEWLKAWWPELAILAAGLLVLIPALFMGLHADDWFQIRPRESSQVLATFAGDWGEGRQHEGGFYRPFVRVAFTVDSFLYGQNAWGYHLTNGLLFLLILFAVYRAGILLTEGNRELVAVLVIALVALNPVKNEALYWASGRTDLLAALFIIAAFGVALKAMERGRASLAGLALALLLGGLLSKEVALAGCAILPAAAWLLRPESRLRTPEKLLLLGPPALGVFYLAFRAMTLGGLAGYEGEPRPAGQFLEAICSYLSALFWPWQSEGPVDYLNWLAVPGLLVSFALLLLARFRRGPVACGVALLLSLLPLSFIDITPSDGTRVLMLPLCFQVLFFASFFRQGHWFRTPPMAAAGFLALTLQADNVAMIGQFLSARKPNQEVVARAWEITRNAPDGSIVIAPEPSSSRTRRILDPGAALIMAMQTKWLRQEATSTEDIADMDVPRFALRLSGPEKSFLLAHALQPWMEAPVTHLVFNEPEELDAVKLRRTGPMEETTVAPDGPDWFVLELEEGEIAAWCAVAANPTNAVPQLQVTRSDGETERLEGFYFSQAEQGVTWLDTTPLREEPVKQVEFVAAGEEVYLRLQRVQSATYEFPGDEEN